MYVRIREVSDALLVRMGVSALLPSKEENCVRMWRRAAGMLGAELRFAVRNIIYLYRVLLVYGYPVLWFRFV